MVALTMTAMVACGEKENEVSTPSDNAGGNDNLGGGGGTSTSEWVDLGLPSGLLWASHNIGASTPEEAGNYYAWGETQPKVQYSDENYKYYIPDGETTHGGLTKYCNDSEYGYHGFVDALTTLVDTDDVAASTLGNGARIPTKNDWKELLDNCTGEWVMQNEMFGYRLTGTNGNSIFLPSPGYRDDTETYYEGDGFYWSSTLAFDAPESGADDPDYAWCFWHAYTSDNAEMTYTTRSRGLSVRPVRTASH